MFVILCLLSFPGAQASDVVDEKLTQRELSQVKKQIKVLKNIIKSTQGRRSKTETNLRKAELEISKTQKNLRNVNDNLKASKKSIEFLRKEQRTLDAAKKRQTKALLSDITAAYQTGRQEYLKLLLNQQNPEKLARSLKYYDYFHQARLGRIENFNGTLSQISSNKSTISTELNKLERFKKQLEIDKALLIKAQGRRKRVIAKLSKSLESKGAKLKHFTTSEVELQTLLDAVQETLADLPAHINSTPFVNRKGKLTWPVKGRISKRFGNRRAQGKLRWNGVIINARTGTAITAVHRGRVVFSDWLRGFGLLTILDHGDGYLSLYGHNEVLNKEPGDWVESGEIIAYSGRNTEQSISGLYFELRHQGKPINPSRWCRT
ncbi:hypothetical protein A9Q81_02455 [Gammaproteobacteria bacterium 42_54_T18]|nr:hypothetical protein A9Q81_02455 [Gammaproteobacteria bacterium 42_54_T18]